MQHFEPLIVPHVETRPLLLPTTHSTRPFLPYQLCLSADAQLTLGITQIELQRTIQSERRPLIDQPHRRTRPAVKANIVSDTLGRGERGHTPRVKDCDPASR
jgi:hypothetical protein